MDSLARKIFWDECREDTLNKVKQQMHTLKCARNSSERKHRKAFTDGCHIFIASKCVNMQ